jgi:PHD/YefM family antitoxin component YafN of YafNO toxin-antitoxin module
VAIDLEGGSGPNGIYIDEADWKYIQRRETTHPPAQPVAAVEPA